MYFLRCLACWLRHAGHDYGAWEWDMGPNGYRVQYRICRRCAWLQEPTRFDDP